MPYWHRLRIISRFCFLSISLINIYGFYNSARESFGAIPDFSEAIKYDSGFIQVYENRGVTKYYPGDFIGALDDFNRVIDSWYSGRKSKSKAYFRRGLVKVDMGDKECACADPGRDR